MFAKISAFYAKRNSREKAMLWCIILGVAFAWMSSQMKANSKLNAEISDYTTKIKVAKTAIAQEPIIKKELEDVLKAFDSSKTLSAVSLQIAVENCARNAGLVYSLSNASTKDAGRFNINSISLSCQKGALKNLAAFEWEMRQIEPYVMFAKSSIEGSNSGEVSAKYEIISFENKQ